MVLNVSIKKSCYGRTLGVMTIIRTPIYTNNKCICNYHPSVVMSFLGLREASSAVIDNKKQNFFFNTYKTNGIPFETIHCNGEHTPHRDCMYTALTRKWPHHSYPNKAHLICFPCSPTPSRRQKK